MPDYGHELALGTFITPSNSEPEQVVGLARLTEEVGLDLATFQDHPYQPRFLDTWTLLSWVAAETTTLRIAPNVANLPLRPPAVLARATASLDLLSKGRLELGLGAGAFWDGVAAMGGPRRTAGESVTALSEAIDEAARAAGRDPRAIRRLANINPIDGPPQEWLKQLVPLVTEHGFSTFIVTGDDPRVIETAGRVAEALRQELGANR